MRILALAAAAALTALAPVVADAQPGPHGPHGPGAHRDDHHGGRFDRRHGYGHRRVCRTVWVHHHRERRCR